MKPSEIAKIDIGDGYFYVATPYSKYPAGIEQAFIDACKVSAKLIEAGVRVYCPIAHTHPIAIHGGIDPYSHEIWMPADLPMMRKAFGLIVVEMLGWDESRGIKEEMKEFGLAMKPVFRVSMEELP